MVMSPFEGSPPLEACTVDAIFGRTPSHLKKRVGTWASLEDGQAHVPTLLSEEWARGRDLRYISNFGIGCEL